MQSTTIGERKASHLSRQKAWRRKALRKTKNQRRIPVRRALRRVRSDLQDLAVGSGEQLVAGQISLILSRIEAGVSPGRASLVNLLRIAAGGA